MGRTVNLILLDAAGAPLGVLPPFDVPVPWWQEVAEVVDGARSAYGVDVQVLRLVHGDQPAPPGGQVTYLAQVYAPPQVPLAPIPAGLVYLPADPRRTPYAQPGGPEASMRWAVDSLATLGTVGANAVQQRTWNLSGIWRLDVAGAPVAWLKQVPPFFAQEAVVLSLVSGVAPGLVPPLLAAGTEGRILLAHVPGADGYGAGADVCAAIAAEFHPVQAHFADRIEELLATGMPDARLTVEQFARVAEPYLETIEGLGELIEGLSGRLAEIAACGLPDTLVHGDLHPGNTRVDGDVLAIMDWGDAVVGHPAYDILRLTEALPAADADAVVAAWVERWRGTTPGSDPAQAVKLMRPIAELRLAVVYSDFLDNIETAERPYHEADVPAHLTAAAAVAGR